MEFQKRLEHCAEMRLHFGGEIFPIRKWVRLVHISDFGEIKLHCIDTFGRLAVGACDVATLEAAVEDRGEARSGLRYLKHLFADLRTARFSIGGPEVEIGQPALEEARAYRGNRMRIPQQGAAVLGLDSSE